jgi:hypothetical protein
MSIFKDTFRRYVRDQLSVRDEVISIGNPADSVRSTDGSDSFVSVNKKDRLKTHNVKLQSGEEITLDPGVFYNYTLNKQAVIRMTSLTDYVSNVDLEIGDLTGNVGFQRLKGATLSQNFILEGGVLSDFARNLDRDKDGTAERVVRSVNQPRASFPRPGQRTNLGYGDFAIGADANEDGFGIVPMPGIEDATIRTKSAYGSLREAKINFVCHNRRQLEVLEMLYMRPGYCVLLEWGWAPFVDNDGKIQEGVTYVEGVTNGKIYTNAITQIEIYNAINKIKEVSCGNYDGLLGFIKNFGFQARPDGGYNCFTELISMNEVIDSLKIPNVSSFRVDAGTDIKGTNIYNPTDQTYRRAQDLGIVSKYNGLYGLIRAINNYANFKNGLDVANDKENTQRAEKIFPELNESYADSAEFNEQRYNLITNEAGGTDRNINLGPYFSRLLSSQASDIKEDLKVKLNVATDEELDNFIIPRIGFTQRVTYRNTIKDGATYQEGENVYGSVQSYIRWDALCILINSSLIPKDEKGYNPVVLLADRIKKPSQKTPEIEPLLYVPITDFITDGPSNIIDFSCDANICILPHQFSLPTANVGDVFGYTPDFRLFPYEYAVATYGVEDKVSYRGMDYTPPNSPGYGYAEIKAEDKWRRIGNIFLNTNMLLTIAERNIDNDQYTLGNFLSDIWAEVNKVCPNHNFVLTDDKEANVVYVIDLPIDSSELPDPSTLHTFIPFSNKNTLRSFDLESQVPSSLSATIAIQAQDPRNISDIDGVTFAAFNRSIKNRLFSRDTNSNLDKIKDSANEKRQQIETEQSILANEIYTFAVNFFANLKNAANDKEVIGEGNIIGILKTYQKNSTYLHQAVNNNSSFVSVIPLTFSAVLDGISGMVIGNIFKVQKDRLPKAYGKTNIGFILFNEEQTITSGQSWTTSIGGKMILLPENKVKVDGAYIPGRVNEATAAVTTELSQVSAGSNSGNTQTLPSDQARVTDIYNARAGSVVYLKRIINSSVVYVGDSPLTSDPNVTKAVGYAFVRVSPEINNERSNFGIINPLDNIIGAFDTIANAGIELGIVLETKSTLVETGKRKILPSAFSKYGINNSGRAIYLDTSQTDPNDTNKLSLTFSSGKKIYVDIADTTDIETIWFRIQFKPEVDSLFKDGYSYIEGPDGKDYIDINGSNESLSTRQGGQKLSNYSKNTADNEGAWMRFDVLATTQASALGN